MSISPKIWVLVDDVIGNSNQALELAKKISDDSEIKKISYNKFAKLPNIFLGLFPMHIKKSTLNDLLANDPPEIIICAGRRLAALAVYLKKIFAKNEQREVKLIQIMKPDLSPKKFDLIILPQHDNFNYVLPNIIRIIGSLHNIKDKIVNTESQFKSTYPSMQNFIAVIIGGSNKNYNFKIQDARKMVKSLKEVSRKKSLKLLVTFSRRTPELVKQYIKNNVLSPHIIYCPSNEDYNPYPTMLSKAQYIITTPDSVSMCSEAVGTGTPVYIYNLPNFVSTKHNYFIQQLMDLGVAKQFDDNTQTLESYNYTPLNELDRVAKLIKENLLG
ncbi:MAG: hypothetical protein DGJ47_000749 [Rickettsiaceae bacterium]